MSITHILPNSILISIFSLILDNFNVILSNKKYTYFIKDLEPYFFYTAMGYKNEGFAHTDCVWEMSETSDI